MYLAGDGQLVFNGQTGSSVFTSLGRITGSFRSYVRKAGSGFVARDICINGAKFLVDNLQTVVDELVRTAGYGVLVIEGFGIVGIYQGIQDILCPRL